MASISANGSLGHHKFTLTVTESSTSVANNTSTVKYTFQLSPVQTSWAWEQWGSSISYTITINGTKYTGTIPAYDGYATVTLKSGSQTVTHSSDGSKSISYSFSVTDGAGQRYTPGNASASGTLKLTNIPRASTFGTITGNTIGSSMTVKINRASSSFDHRLYYKVGNMDWIRVGLHVETEATFTISTTTAKQIPNSTSGTLQLLLKTYNGSTQIGENLYKDVTVNVPSYSITVNSVNLTGNNLLDGEYVQGKSTVTVDINASANSTYGGTIKSYSTTIDGKTYTGSKFTTSVLTTGTKEATVTVVDSRGKTATIKSNAIIVYAWSKPYISEFTLERQSDGTTVIATLKGAVAPINNKNAKEITIRIDFNGYTNYVYVDGYTINATSKFANIPTDSTFTATAKITDSYATTTKEALLSTVAVTMDFHHSGKGVSFGKVAEEEALLDIDWNVRIKGNNLVDFVFYRDTVDSWIVEKYISGKIEAYRSVSINTAVATAYGNGYYNGSTLSVVLPSDFLNNAFPVINLNAQSTQAQILDASIASYNQAERKISYYVTSPGKQATSYQIWMHFRVVGRWK